MPPTMVVDADGTLRWTPTEIDRATGTLSWSITADDEDGGRSRQEVVVEVRGNAPPPVPVLVHPTGEEPVRTLRPTIILENAADADGDPLEYTIQVDRNVCFCTGERMDSGALRAG